MKQDDEPTDRVELEVDLEEPPQKVWRAISLPELREAWLPAEALSDPEPASLTPGQEVRYRLREREAPFLESSVTFTIAPNGSGGTSLRILHILETAKFGRRTSAAANDNRMMLAA